MKRKDKSFKHIHRVLWPLVKRHDGKFKRELIVYYIKKILKLSLWHFAWRFGNKKRIVKEGL